MYYIRSILSLSLGCILLASSLPAQTKDVKEEAKRTIVQKASWTWTWKGGKGDPWKTAAHKYEISFQGDELVAVTRHYMDGVNRSFQTERVPIRLLDASRIRVDVTSATIPTLGKNDVSITFGPNQETRSQMSFNCKDANTAHELAQAFKQLITGKAEAPPEKKVVVKEKEAQKNSKVKIFGYVKGVPRGTVLNW